MEGEKDSLLLTRREVLYRTTQGVAALALAPWLNQAESFLARNSPPALRSRESFDFGWRFTRGDPADAQNLDFPDASWRVLDLPHDWSIEGPYSETEPASGSGGYLPTGLAWYRKRFNVPESSRGRTVTLEFDGVYQNSQVWVNGHSLGVRPYGFVPFAYELTPYLRFGAENVVAVRVDNSHQTNCRWYSGSGIYRRTWLLTTNRIRVAYWGTFVSSMQVAADRAILRIETTVLNGEKHPVSCSLATTLHDVSGNPAAPEAIAYVPHSLAPGRPFKFVQQMAVAHPRLWSLDDPHLYSVRSTLRASGRDVDLIDTPTGIRSAVFDVDRGFLLNGQHIKLNGVCLHQEAGCVGSAVPEGVWERRLALLRAMGCNAIRPSHNPFAAEFYDLCDRMGFLVMNEAFDEWRIAKGQIQNGYHLYFDEWHQRDLENFIRRDRNHPSVVLWSAGNEVPDQSAPDGAETLRDILKVFRAEDPTRPVTVACDQIASEPLSKRVRTEFLAALDLVGYNYVDRWRNRADLYYSIDHAAFPHRRVIGTESVGIGGIRGEYRDLAPQKNDDPLPWFFHPSNLRIDAEHLWQFVDLHDYVSGDFTWTGIDYLGETRWPMKSAPAGALDTCGFPKDCYFFYQSQWTHQPMLHLFPHWNWWGREGEIISVTCYTNCDTVELFLNGKSLGTKGYEFPRLGMEERYGNVPPRALALRTTADLHLSWDVPYTPGKLCAVGTKDGKTAVVREVSTTGDPAALAITADRSDLAADRRDVAHLTVAVQDAQGRTVPDADHSITVSVAGQGRLIGVDNGDPFSHENYQGPVRRAFNGLSLAIIQTTASAGQIQVTAESPGLRSASMILTTA